MRKWYDDGNGWANRLTFALADAAWFVAQQACGGKFPTGRGEFRRALVLGDMEKLMPPPGSAPPPPDAPVTGASVAAAMGVDLAALPVRRDLPTAETLVAWTAERAEQAAKAEAGEVGFGAVVAAVKAVGGTDDAPPAVPPERRPGVGPAG